MRETSVSLMNQHMRDSQGSPFADFMSEARFYCEENDFDYRKAKVAYDGDRAFELEQMKKNGKKSRK